MTDDFMNSICAEHDLRTLTVTYSRVYSSFTVYLHWGRPEDQLCASGSSNGIDEALAAAVAEMLDKRVEVAA